MRKGQNIRKRKDGRWEARYYDKLKNKYVSVYAKSYNQVKEKLQLLLLNNQLSNTSITIKQASLLMLADKEINVKKSTYAKYYDIVYKHIVPVIGEIKCSKVTQSDIDNFINYKYLHGQLNSNDGLSLKTIKDIINILKQVMEKNCLHFEYKLPTCQKKDICIMSNNEYDIFSQYLLLGTDNIKLGLLLALACGIRMGELCALTWGDIDLINGVICITKTLQRIKNTNNTADKKTIIIIDTPKTSMAVRKIPIPTFLLNRLSLYEQNSENYILTGTKHYIEPRTLHNKFKKHILACGIKNINFHALRHTFATRCMEQNIDIKSLSEILGHTDVKFTLNRYVHSSLDYKRSELERISLALWGQNNGQKNTESLIN